MADIILKTNETRERIYTATAAQTDFSVPFRYESADEMGVTVVDADGVSTEPDFVMVPSGAYGTEDQPGILRLTAPLEGGERVEVYGVTPRGRVTSLAASQGNPSGKLNQEYSNLQKQVQEITTVLARALRARRGEALPVLPPKSSLAGMILWLNEAMTSWELLPAAGLSAIAADLASPLSVLNAVAAKLDAVEQVADVDVEVAALGPYAAALAAALPALLTVAQAIEDGLIAALVGDRAVIVAQGIAADCTSVGVGTDDSAALQAALNDWKAAGHGSVLVVPGGNKRLASGVSIDLDGLKFMEIRIEGSITPDATAMKVMRFRNAFDISIKAKALDGGCYVSGGANGGYLANYETTDDVVSAGGQEFIEIRSIDNYTVDLVGSNYAGRLLAVRRVSGDYPDEPVTAFAHGKVRTTRQNDPTKPRCAQALWGYNTDAFTGAFGGLDYMNMDFDYFPPVWTDFNDISLGYMEGAFATNGPHFKGCQMIQGTLWYIGDVDGNPSNAHIWIGPSATRLSAQVDVDKVTGLNAGTIVKLVDLDTNYRSRFGSINAIGSSGNAYTAAFHVDNCANVSANIYGNNHGGKLAYIEGGASDIIQLNVEGNGLSEDFVHFAADFGGTAVVNGVARNPASGKSLVKVEAGVAVVDAAYLIAGANNGFVFDVPSSNAVRWLGGLGSLTGAGALYKNGHSPSVVTELVRGVAGTRKELFSDMRLRKISPIFEWWNEGAAPDNRRWKFYALGDQLLLTVVNDVDGADARVLTVSRSGLTITRIDLGGPLNIPSYTVAGLPSAAALGAGTQVYVSNESGGAVMAFSDGASWRRMTDRAVVS